jgi:hypothetical protein
MRHQHNTLPKNKIDSQGHVEEALLLLQHNLRRGSLVSEKFVHAQSVNKKKLSYFDKKKTPIQNVLSFFA